MGKWRSIEDSGKQVEFFHGADNLYHGKVINSVNKSIPNGHLLFKNGVYVPADHTIKGFLSSPGRSLEIDATIIFITQDKLKVIGRTFLITKTLFFDRII